MANPANLAAQGQDERIPGLPALPAGTDPATLTVPVYNPATDKTHQAPIGGPPATSNAVIGGPKLVQYVDSRYYGVPAGALTLDRLLPATIVPGTLATVENPSPTPLTATEAPKQYVAGLVAAGTPGAVLVPRYIGAAAGDTVAIGWQAANLVLTAQAVLAQTDVVASAAAGVQVSIINNLLVFAASPTTPPANQAPSVTINGSATGTVGTQQSFQAVASDSDGLVDKVELCLMANATSLLNYTVLDMDPASPFVLDWTPTAAGNFILRMRATDDKGATSFSSALAVQVANATSPPTATLTPTHANYSFNPAATETLAGAPLPAAYALLGVSVQAQPTVLTVPYASNLGDTGYLALLDDTGALLAHYALPDTGGAMTGSVQVALPGSGAARRFRLQLPKRQYNATSYVVNGVALGQLSFDTGMGSFYQVPARGIGAWVEADSILNQAGPDQADGAQYAAAPTWRRNGVDIFLHGGGGYRGYPVIATAADIEAQAQLVVATLAPYALPTYFDATGPNDYGQGTDPATLSIARRDLYRRIHSLRPDIQIVRQTMLNNGYGNDPNSLGNPAHSTQEYRAADEQYIFATESYVRKADGPSLLAYTTDNYQSDRLHPTLLGTVILVGQQYPFFFLPSNVVGVGQYVDETNVLTSGGPWITYVTPDALGGSRIYTNGGTSGFSESPAMQGGMFVGYAPPQVGHHYDVYLTDLTTGIRKKYLEVRDTQTTKPTIVPPSATTPYKLRVVAVAGYGTPANGGQAVWDAWFVRDNVDNLPPTPEILDAYVAGDHVEQDAFLNTSSMNVNNSAGSGGSRIFIDNVDLTTTLNKQFKAATVLFNSGDFGPGWKFDVDVLPADGSATFTVTLADGDAHEGLVNNPYASQYCTLKARCVKAYSQGAGTSTGALVLDCVDFS